VWLITSYWYNYWYGCNIDEFGGTDRV